jgi:hypothetical protein
MDVAAIIESHLPDLDHSQRATVERLIDMILDQLPGAQHEL